MLSQKRNLAGPFIKCFRQAAGLSQFDLSVAMEVDHEASLTQSDISEIERGARQVTDFELVSFSRVLKVPIKSLVEGDENETN